MTNNHKKTVNSGFIIPTEGIKPNIITAYCTNCTTEWATYKDDRRSRTSDQKLNQKSGKLRSENWRQQGSKKY